MAKIIEDNESFKKQLEDKLIISPTANNATYIYLNYIDSQNDERADRLGLNYAVEELKNNPERTIILYSFENPQELYLDNNFMNVMARENVHFIRLPFIKGTLDAELKTPKFYNQALDIASRVNQNTDLRGVLLHAYSHNPAKVLEKIKINFGFIGTEKEIINQLRSYNFQAAEPKGFLPGVFVDVQGTLTQGGKINTQVIEMIRNYAKTRPVNIWTGADRKEMTRCINNHLYKAFEDLDDDVTPTRIPILSKQTFRGFEPELIIDDMTTEEFVKTYQMTPKEHIRIK